MNFTHPENLEREDTPQDWLASALIFAGALGHLLKENEGVVVKVTSEDLSNIVEGTSYIVSHNEKGQIVIEENGEEAEDGQLVWMHDPDEKEEVV